MKNLALSHMRGKSKPTELYRVLKWLVEEQGLSLDEVAKRTGYRRDYLERLLSLSRLIPAAWEALDEGLIRVGHAYELARLPNEELQEKMLALCLEYKPTVKLFHEMVDKCIEAYKRSLEQPEHTPEPQPRPEPEEKYIKCDFCGREWPEGMVVGKVICMRCFGIAYDAIQRKIKQELLAQSLVAGASTPPRVEPEKGIESCKRPLHYWHTTTSWNPRKGLKEDFLTHLLSPPWPCGTRERD